MGFGMSTLSRGTRIALASVSAVAVVASAATYLVVRSDDTPVVPPNTTDRRECIGRGAGGWSFFSYVSDNDGLVLGEASLGNRTMTRMISVPYLEAELDTSKESRLAKIELTPRPELAHRGVLGTRLSAFTCHGNDAGDIFVHAEFTIDRFTPAKDSTLVVTQEHRFRGRDDTQPCEATGEFACARYWPTISYRYRDAGCLTQAGSTCPGLAKLSTVQRMEFAPDGHPDGAVDAFLDRGLVAGAITRSGVDTKGSGGSMRYEAIDQAIVGGGKGSWDSIHQSATLKASGPGINLGNLTPGCPSCIHIHWNWGLAANTAGVVDTVTCNRLISDCSNVANHVFTDGRPQILDGSKQDATFGIVRVEPGELDPVEQGWASLVDDEGTPESEIRGHATAIYWEMSSARDHDAAWPLLDDDRHGGNGAIFFGASHVHQESSSTTTSGRDDEAPPEDRIITHDQLVAAIPNASDAPEGYVLSDNAVDEPAAPIQITQDDNRDPSCELTEDNPPQYVTQTEFAQGTGAVSERFGRELTLQRWLSDEAADEMTRWREAAVACPTNRIRLVRTSDGAENFVSFQRRVVAVPGVGDESFAVVNRAHNRTTGVDFVIASVTTRRRNAISFLGVTLDLGDHASGWPASGSADRVQAEDDAAALVAQLAPRLDQDLVDVVGP